MAILKEPPNLRIRCNSQKKSYLFSLFSTSSAFPFIQPPLSRNTSFSKKSNFYRPIPLQSLKTPHKPHLTPSPHRKNHPSRFQNPFAPNGLPFQPNKNPFTPHKHPFPRNTNPSHPHKNPPHRNNLPPIQNANSSPRNNNPHYPITLPLSQQPSPFHPNTNSNHKDTISLFKRRNLS